MFGNTVLCHCCVSFFAPPGRKMIHKGLKPTDKRKSYVGHFFRSRGKNDPQGVESDRHAKVLILLSLVIRALRTREQSGAHWANSIKLSGWRVLHRAHA